MKTIQAWCGVAACLFAGMAGNAWADVLFYEGFDYAAGAPMHGLSPNGINTWQTFNDSGGNVVAGAGLSFADAGYGPGYAVSGLATVVNGANAGNGGSWGNYAYSSLNIPAGSLPLSTHYYSMLVKNISAATGNGFSFQLQSAFRPGVEYGAFQSGFYGGGPYDFTVEAYNQQTNTYPSDSTGMPATPGNTFFVVLRLRGDASYNWTADLAINPTFADEPVAWDASVSFVRGTLPHLAFLIAPQGGYEFVFDELRIATTWADALPVAAVPEPSSAVALASLGALVFAVGRRRGRSGGRGQVA